MLTDLSFKTPVLYFHSAASHPSTILLFFFLFFFLFFAYSKPCLPLPLAHTPLLFGKCSSSTAVESPSCILTARESASLVLKADGDWLGWLDRWTRGILDDCRRSVLHPLGSCSLRNACTGGKKKKKEKKKRLKRDKPAIASLPTRCRGSRLRLECAPCMRPSCQRCFPE